MSNNRRILISHVLLFIFIFNILQPLSVYAITGGPSQPEFQAFEEVGASDMVDLFTGDFKYNIPLLDVGGYPININYSASPNMEQEATWVGLGWNLNVGAINRNMRGVPDEFRHRDDKIEKTIFEKPEWSVGLNVSKEFKLFGLSTTKLNNKLENRPGKNVNLNAGLGIEYNNYTLLNPNIALKVKLVQDRQEINEKQKKETENRILDSIAKNDPKKRLSMVVESSFENSIKSMFYNNFPEFAMVTQIAENSSASDRVRNIRKLTSSNIYNNSFQSYLYKSYFPDQGIEYKQHNYRLDLKFGPAVTGFFANSYVEGNYYKKELSNTYISNPVYGYMYHWEKDNGNNNMLDINRERDGVYFTGKANLPIPIQTYDLYSVSGQGVAGQMRLFRNTTDILNSETKKSNSTSGYSGIEFGSLTDLHLKINARLEIQNQTTGNWHTSLAKNIEKRTQDKNAANTQIHEHTYFKMVGEKTINNSELVQNINRNSVLFPKVQRKDIINMSSPDVFKALEIGNNHASEVNTGSVTNKRAPRNQYIRMLTFADKNYFFEPNQIGQSKYNNIEGLQWQMYPINSTVSYLMTEDFNPSMINNQSPTSYQQVRKGHHIGEFTIVNPDGTTYVYGQAAYVRSHKEVTFSCGESGTIKSPSILSYHSNNPADGQEFLNSLYDKFKTGTLTDGFNISRSSQSYTANVLSPYAHAYLLTNILSQDYVDIVPSGVGPEDYGNYVKFNYFLLSDSYKWRTPYTPGDVNYTRGVLSESYDNKATYTEGTKEIWILNEIFTKTHVAIFIVENRDDAKGSSTDPNGQSMVRLRRIVLYDREKYQYAIDNGLDIKTVEPEKSVWFEYDYSLCKKVPNNVNSLSISNSGKLTLKEVYITYGNNAKKFSSYKFEYNISNPDYNPEHVDRWGNYKEATPAETDHFDYPYVDQSTKSQNDIYASAWSLSQIKLPTGGIIKIAYECDDYAFVQDKSAMEMMKLAGVGSSDDYVPSNTLYNKVEASINNNLYMYFNIPVEFRGSPSSQQLYADWCMKDNSILLFKVFAKLVGGKYEWLRGYAKTLEYGICPNTNDFFYVKVEPKKRRIINLESTQIHPITMTGLDFVKHNLNHLFNPTFAEALKNDVGIKQVVAKLLTIDDIITTFKGEDAFLISEGYFRELNLNKSWVRMNSPFKKKMGGGSRVKSITLTDNWKNLTNNTNGFDQDYIYEYKYTKQESYSVDNVEYKREISSGVAAYEPLAGSEENPFKLPLYSHQRTGYLAQQSQVEDGPLGESFYPSPLVGYSSVTVTTNGKVGTNNYSSSNIAVHEFYTAADFPVIFKQTEIHAEKINPPFVNIMLLSLHLEKIAVSQGYYIELNDMHGKPKSTKKYQLDKNYLNPKLVESTEYYYKTKIDNPKQLDNEILVSDENHNITGKEVAVERDFYMDNRSSEINNYSGEIGLNTETLITMFGLTFPIPTANVGKRDENFYSSVATTLVNKYGILYKTIITREGSTISSEHLVYDGITGQPIVTRTKDEYKEDLYNTTIPAYWYYDGMGPKYLNEGITINNFTSEYNNGNGVLFITDPLVTQYLKNGDKVVLTFTNNSIDDEDIFTVNKIGSSFVLNTNYSTKNYSPNTYTNFSKLRILKSGANNNQSNTAINLSSLGITYNNNSLTFLQSKVISADGFEFAIPINYYRNFIYNTHNSQLGVNTPLDYLSIVRAINYLLKNEIINLTICSTCTQTYNIPQTIFQGNNYYTNSAIGKIRTKNNKDHNLIIQSNFNLLTNKLDLIIKLVYNDQTSFDPNIVAEYVLNIANINVPEEMIIASQNNTNIRLQEINPRRLLNLYEIKVGINSDSRILLGSKLNGLNLYGTVNDYIMLSNQVVGNIIVENDGHIINGQNSTSLIYYYAAKSEYKYKDDRIYSNTLKSGRQGEFKSFYNLYNSQKQISIGDKWKQKSLVTLFDPYSAMAVETIDPLNNYQSIIKDKNSYLYKSNSLSNLNYYTQSRVLANAVNARNCQYTAYNFENIRDVGNSVSENTLTDLHYFFPQNTNSQCSITNVQSHTGISSLFLRGVAKSIALVSPGYDNDPAYTEDIFPFYPQPGKYQITGWVYNQSLTNINTTVNSNNLPNCKVKFVNTRIYNPSSTTNTTDLVVAYPEGPSINGWKRFVATFEIPQFNNEFVGAMLLIELSSGTPTNVVYFDDLRISPLNSTMKHYVYNNKREVIGILDENNYATYYKYNSQGQLILVRRETEKGVVTVKENRKSNSKIFVP
jgi:hypothetical protein